MSKIVSSAFCFNLHFIYLLTSSEAEAKEPSVHQEGPVVKSDKDSAEGDVGSETVTDMKERTINTNRTGKIHKSSHGHKKRKNKSRHRYMI